MADEEAREFIAEHGGNVYVWANEAGLKHVALAPPGDPVEFASLDAEGFTLHQDVTIQSPTDEWKVVLRHIPHKHVDALWDGWEPGIGAPWPPDD